MENKKLVIGHLYPDLLNLYGDYGNILTLKNRLLWRGLEAEIIAVTQDMPIDFKKLDIVFLGGGSEREQLMVSKLLQKQQTELSNFIEDGGVCMAVCGGYQLLGKTYPQDGKEAEGLSILNIETEVNEDRLIGNAVIKTDIMGEETLVVGFENHAGRTHIGSHKPFGQVLAGFGNNGADGTCGVIYKNLIGTYLLGPLLPKNPALADYLLQQALLRRYGDGSLIALQDKAENEAHEYAIKRFLNR